MSPALAKYETEAMTGLSGDQAALDNSNRNSAKDILEGEVPIMLPRTPTDNSEMEELHPIAILTGVIVLFVKIKKRALFIAGFGLPA